MYVYWYFSFFKIKGTFWFERNCVIHMYATSPEMDSGGTHQADSHSWYALIAPNSIGSLYLESWHSFILYKLFPNFSLPEWSTSIFSSKYDGGGRAYPGVWTVFFALNRFSMKSIILLMVSLFNHQVLFFPRLSKRVDLNMNKLGFPWGFYYKNSLRYKDMAKSSRSGLCTSIY